MFHFPVEAIGSIVKLWRGRRAVDSANMFTDPAVERRDRIWRLVLALIVTFGFLVMMAIPVWLFIQAFSIPPPTPEQIQQRRMMMMRNAAGTNAPSTPSIPQTGQAATNQPKNRPDQ